MTKLAISIGTLEIGGAEMFVFNILNNLNYQKYKVLLIVLSYKVNSFLEEEISKLPVEVIYINKKEGFRPFALLKITKILNMFKPDILHGNIGGMIYFLGYLLLNRKIKMIYTAHTLANLEFGKIKRKVISYFIHRNKIIPVAISKAVKKSIVETYQLEDNQVRLINNGINVQKFKFDRCYEFNPLVIGHVGRFVDVKNHKMIVKVYQELIKRYPDIKLKLIGDGPLFHEIKEELKDNHVTMIKNSSMVFEEIKEIDIFFFPSVYEGLPLSLIEAMASGCVIIASRVGGISDLIEGGENGYLLDDCNDFEGFLNLFHMLINNKDNIIRISKNNIIKANQFDIKFMVEKYQDLYLEENDVKRTI